MLSANIASLLQMDQVNDKWNNVQLKESIQLILKLHPASGETPENQK